MADFFNPGGTGSGTSDPIEQDISTNDTEMSLNKEIVNIKNNLQIGNYITSSGEQLYGYRLPNSVTDAQDGQILKLKKNSGSISLLEWSTLETGGGNYIQNGGQNEAVTIGTSGEVKNDVNIISNGKINIGASDTPDQIVFNGSVGYQIDDITLDSTTTSFTLNSAHYYVNVINNGAVNINDSRTIYLPKCSLENKGRVYIISKGFESGKLVVSSDSSDTLDEDNVITISKKNCKIKIISNGVNRWVVF